MQHLLSAASSWIPEAMVESAWTEHAPFAFWLVDAHRPSMLVELGTHYGYSYFAFNQALRKLQVKCRCFAIDTWAGDEHAGYYDDQVFEGVRTHNEEQFADFSELLRMTFDEALSRFEDGSIDLLHIDGRHFYEDVKHDFETWLPKLSKRAVVLLHDTNVRAHDFGVYRLWEELKPRYPHFEFLSGHGLGVLGVGKEVPLALCDLFAALADENRAEMVRAIYGRLGSAIADRAHLHRLAQQETSVREQVSVVQKVIHEAALVQAEYAKLASTNSSLEAELDRGREQIASLTQALNDAAAEKEEITQTNSGLKKELEITSEQLDKSQLLTRQQALVIQRIQNEAILQSQKCQSWQNEVLLMKAEVLKYSQILDDVSRLVVPVPIRKLFPSFMRRPVQAFKQKMQTQAHHSS